LSSCAASCVLQVIQAGLGDTVLVVVRDGCGGFFLSLRASRSVLLRSSLRSSRRVVRSPRVMNASGPSSVLEAFGFFLGRFAPDPLDLDFGVTGAVRAEHNERAVADMLRAEKKKAELPLGLSRHVC